MADGGFSRQQVCSITGLSARQLSYWRNTCLITPQGRTSGGHARYSFTDLVALTTAKRLIDAVPVPDPSRKRHRFPRMDSDIPSPVYPLGAGPARNALVDMGEGHLVGAAS